MDGFKLSALCLLGSICTNVQAANPAEIKLELSQFSSAQCTGALTTMNTVIPGDCITYRIVVENMGEETAHQVQVSALVPEHTELRGSIRDVTNQQQLGTVVEHQAGGDSVVKAALTSVPAGSSGQVVLEYSVRVL